MVAHVFCERSDFDVRPIEKKTVVNPGGACLDVIDASGSPIRRHQRLFTDKLVFRWLEVLGVWSLDSATPATPANPAHASGSPRYVRLSGCLGIECREASKRVYDTISTDDTFTRILKRVFWRPHILRRLTIL
jgi:hypothetical protein